MITILITDDDRNMRLLMRANLEAEYNIITAENGEKALEVLESNRVDLIIADVMMPKMDGYTFVERVRETSDIPILMVTAKSETQDKVSGFTSGADDYLTKPIDYEELKVRIKALLRRANINDQKKIVIADIIIDEKTYSVSRGETRIELPKKEFELFYKLLSYPGQIFTKDQLLEDIWGYDSESTENTIKVHISRIRKRLVDFPELKIVAIKGLGYKGEIKTYDR